MLGGEGVGLFEQRKPEAFSDRPGLEHADAKQPAPVETKPAGQRQIEQVVPGIEVDPVSGDIAARPIAGTAGLGLVVAPAQPNLQRQLHPRVQIRVGRGEPALLTQESATTVFTPDTVGEELFVLAGLAMPGTLSGIGVR